MAEVIRTGRSALYPDIPDAMLLQAAIDDEHLEILRSLGIRSVMTVPLVARGVTLGAITLVSAESGRRYGPEDLPFAEGWFDCAVSASHPSGDHTVLFGDVREAGFGSGGEPLLYYEGRYYSIGSD